MFERMIESGELVQPGQPVVVVGSTDSGWGVRVTSSDAMAMAKMAFSRFSASDARSRSPAMPR